jgi:Fur family transcriptional regulator, ferric uptake regulator
MADPSFHRTTRQREVIIEELRASHEHPTAAELYQSVRRRVPNISLGTVYRNLDLLSQAGMIRKLDAAGGEARFDGNLEPHDHLRCVRCGAVSDAGRTPVALPQDPPACGYRLFGYRLEFIGICPGCWDATHLTKAQGSTDNVEG